MATKEESLSSEALDVVGQLLFELDEKRELDDFYDRICEAVCRKTTMERAVLFLYDSDRRLGPPPRPLQQPPEEVLGAPPDLERRQVT